ncbi:unnamed protein product [Protopolystoma xenopodis]|uniref:Uncharacterized protein n=1 Tax=Protopolystoma xenopodis TaxID=117903 RepID=A0A3S5AV81_9PLAT|nr:unnamed protein product [Protopolystoma xenopodis]
MQLSSFLLSKIGKPMGQKSVHSFILYGPDRLFDNTEIIEEKTSGLFRRTLWAGGKKVALDARSHNLVAYRSEDEHCSEDGTKLP